jgi:uncharacterized protein (UPF0548 family)
MSSRRQSFHGDQPVSYASVGITQAPDVLVFPPQGFKAVYKEFRLGSGQERFDSATESLMTWGIARGSHLLVTAVDQEDSEGYRGIMFNEFGAPIQPHQEGSEQLFSSDGTPFLSAGTTVTIEKMWSPSHLSSSLRVIYVVREERRQGYAWGTLNMTPVVGEEFFSVELRDDDSVYCVLRSVTAIAEGNKFRWLAPLIRLKQWQQQRQYVRALLPARLA